MLKEIIYIATGLFYIIAGAVILSKGGVKKEIKYSEAYLEQKRLISFIYDQESILK